MAKLIAIPKQIVECLQFFSPADRGDAYQAILTYIDSGKMPSQDISPAARGAFEFAKRIIDPILERRRRAAQRRLDRKNAQATGELPSAKNTSQTAGLPAENDTSPQTRKHQKIKVNPEHIFAMRSIVKAAYSSSFRTEEERDATIRWEMHRRYPGIYRDITYDKSGFIQLHPVAA